MCRGQKGDLGKALSVALETYTAFLWLCIAIRFDGKNQNGIISLYLSREATFGFCCFVNRLVFITR